MSGLAAQLACEPLFLRAGSVLGFACARVSLVELGDSEAIDLFLREEDARTALEDAIRDEPEWAGLLYVKPVDLDEREVSAN